ncbi:hydroxyisourate hydrolase [Spizellomyces sp. 'palustris']|nr:hydroxyisourate hydrolase [Spizellomyces sp. 'palustris']
MSHKSPITTHVLDTTHGIAAKGISITLEISTAAAAVSSSSQSWKLLAEGTTNEDGRCTALLPGSQAGPHALKSGIYRMSFAVKEYFQRFEMTSIFPFVQVVFEIPEQPNPHYHIPLLLSPYSYSTYRGT